MIRVAFLVTDLGLGGTQAFVELAATNLIGRGHQVTVFVEHGPVDRQQRLVAVGVDVVTFTELPALADYAREIRQRGIELVHLNVWERLEYLRGLRNAARVPLLLSYHHVPVVRPWRERLLDPRRGIAFLRDAVQAARGIDVHVGCCETAAVAIRSILGPIWGHRAYALRNAIPLPAVNSADVLSGSAHFLQVGTLTARKNPVATLEGFALLVKEYPEARLTFVGDGPERGRLAAIVQEQQIPGVTLAGELADTDSYYRKANIMVLPSFCEGLPYTLIEAAGRGIPIIASQVDGIPEIVRSQENGLLVDPADTDGLSAAMRLLATDLQLRVAMGQNGRRLVQERFEIAGFTEALVDIYRKTLANAGVREHQ